MRASSGNASNLLSHLRVHYPMQYTQVLQLQMAKGKENDKSIYVHSSSQAQSSIPELFSKAQKYERTSQRWHEKLQIPNIQKKCFLSTKTEKDGFRQFATTLDPKYDIPSAKVQQRLHCISKPESRFPAILLKPSILQQPQICGQALLWSLT